MDILKDAPLSQFTTFRIGGPCRRLIRCREPAEVLEAVQCLEKENQPFTVIGQGSNLLVADDGHEGVVIRYADSACAFRQMAEGIEVAGGCLLDELVQRLAEEGLGGLEFAAGLPGTVGGAICGNAGAFGKQVGDRVVQVTLASPDGRVRTARGHELKFMYRGSALQETGEIVLTAVLAVMPADRAYLLEECARIREVRRQKHPDWTTIGTAGSFFKNVFDPVSGTRKAAGWFLDQVGAKSMRVGRARVYEKHANIIVAEPGATAREVLLLAHQMADAVRQHFGIALEPEVRLLGKFPPELQFGH